MEYNKINSIWKRHGMIMDDAQRKDPSLKGKKLSLIDGDYACREFGSINKWLVDEKVDGTNIRVFWEQEHVGAVHDVRFGGRTDRAQLPPTLLKSLTDLFPADKFINNFSDTNRVVLFGEGYGPKIQACGGNYRSDAGFILFDIFIDGWWLERTAVKELADKLEINVVPEIGIMSEGEIIEFVKSKPMSRCSNVPQMMEGVVCRSDPLMLFRNKKPVMWKLKCKEFIA